MGYPVGSVGYRVWDPVRGKVCNLGVPDIDENVAPRWWRGEDIGGEIVDDIKEVVFPDLEADIIPVVVHGPEQEDTLQIPICFAGC